MSTVLPCPSWSSQWANWFCWGLWFKRMFSLRCKRQMLCQRWDHCTVARMVSSCVTFMMTGRVCWKSPPRTTVMPLKGTLTERKLWRDLSIVSTTWLNESPMSVGDKDEVKKHENPLVLHCSFIPDDKINTAQHYCLFWVFVNVAQGILTQPINRNQKHGVCCMSTWKEKGCDTWRCHAKYDLTVSADMVTQSLIHKCLSCPSRTIEEKHLTRLKAHGIEDGFISIELISIEFTEVVICQCQFISFCYMQVVLKGMGFHRHGPSRCQCEAC